MREYLFRGKRKDNGEWVDGGSIFKLINKIGEHFFMPQYGEKLIATHDDNMMNIVALENMTMYRVDPETVGQYTGLRDCKRTKAYPEGQMIFEGDIVKCRHEFHNWDWKLYGRDKEEAFRTKKIRRAYKKEVFKDDYSCSCYYLRNYVIAVRDGAWEIRNGSDGHGIKDSFIIGHEIEVIGNIHDNPELLKEGGE